MKPLLFTLVMALLSFASQAQLSFSVSGNVKNSKGENLASATVFIDGSSTATSTDANGNYTLNNITSGTYYIAVSMIGYGPERNVVTVNNASAVRNFVMQVRPVALKEVTIGDPSGRAEKLRVFRNKFLGQTENAYSCKILNPEIINFATNKTILVASTDEFLIIENQNLGYRIKYLLKVFNHDKARNLTSYTGDCIFEELSGSEKQQKAWAANRQKAYEGSFMHYLRSLYAGNSTNEGFKSYPVVDQGKQYVITDATEPEDMTKYVTRIDSNFVKLSFKMLLQVKYKKMTGTVVKEPTKDRNGVVIAAARLFHDGIVKMYLDYTKVDRNGNYLDFRSFLLEHLWNDLQVGDRLPYTYWPEKR